MEPQLIGQASVKEAFRSGIVSRVMVLKQEGGGWFLSFEASDPIGENVVQYALRTQRNKLRVWKDLRGLIRFVERHFGASNFFMERKNDEQDD